MSTTTTSTLPKTGTYTIDKAHTEVGFVARHLVGTKVRGRFTKVRRHPWSLPRAQRIRGIEATVETRPSIDTGIQRCAMTTCAPTTSSTHPSTPQLTLKSTGLEQRKGTEWTLPHRPHPRRGKTLSGGLRARVSWALALDARGIDCGSGLSASAQIDRPTSGVNFNQGLLDGRRSGDQQQDQGDRARAWRPPAWLPESPRRVRLACPCWSRSGSAPGVPDWSPRTRLAR